jgi:hypothetical protein
MSMPPQQPVEGIVVYLDIYGFEALVRLEKLEDIMLIMTSVYDQIVKLLSNRRQHRAELFILSDCIFLFYPVHDIKYIVKTIQKCIDDTKEILSIYLDNKLPLRGGIAYGPVIFKDRLLIGDAVTRAARYEKWISAPVVLFPEIEIFNRVPEFALSRIPSEFFKSTQLRDGRRISARLIIPAHTEKFEETIDRNAFHYLIHGPYDVAQVWDDAKMYKDFYISRD